MRLSEFLTCQNYTTKELIGYQATLKDTRTHNSFALETVGVMNEDNSTTAICKVFMADTDQDYLNMLRIGFNDSGVYGLEFRTGLDHVINVGTSVNHITLENAL